MAKSLIFLDLKKNFEAFHSLIQTPSALIDISDIVGQGGDEYLHHLYNGDLADILHSSYSHIESVKNLIAKNSAVAFATCPDFIGDSVARALMNLLETKNGNASRLLLSSSSIKELQQKPRASKRQPHSFNLLEKFIALDHVFNVNARKVLDVDKKNLPVFGLTAAFALDLLCRHDAQDQRTDRQQDQISGNFTYKGRTIRAALTKVNGNPAEIRNKHVATAMIIDLKEQHFNIKGLRTKQFTKSPLSPLTTTKLLAAAEKHLGFNPQKTRTIARDLYAARNIGLKIPVGLITYPTTTSLFIPEEDLLATREYILINYGKDYLPDKANIFSENAPNGIGAIRPTRLSKPPQKVKKYLDADEHALYTLIWNRHLATQMVEALFQQQDLKISGGPQNRYIFQTQNHYIIRRGYLQLYPDATHAAGYSQLDNSDKNGRIESVEFSIAKEKKQESFAYSEALLYDAVCDLDINLLETMEYAVQSLKKWKFVTSKNDGIYATAQGRQAQRLLNLYYPDIINKAFLRRLKKKLLKPPARGKIPIDHAEELQKLLHNRTAQINREAATLFKTQQCPVCGGVMQLKQNENGRFLVCENHPHSCQYTKSIDVHAHRYYGRCPECDNELTVKIGRFGRFLACASFPKCKFTKPYPIDVHCPKPGCNGEIIERTTSKGQLFYGCSSYPTCSFSSWQKPANIACPFCGNDYVTETEDANSGRFKCPKCKKEIDMLDINQPGRE